jgi:RNA polymerase sigma-70 factor (ECF subfamily)
MGEQASEEKLERIFSDHYVAVKAYAHRRVPAALVDDVVAGTFLVVWRRLDEVPEEARPWLLAVARNVAATERRSARRKRSLLERLKTIAPHRGFELEAGFEPSPVVEALSKLSEKDREAITLVAWDELAPAEAAVVLDLSPAAFRVRLHRAKARLRSGLNGGLAVTGHQEDDRERRTP